jgi:hypothetical protein
MEIYTTGMQTFLAKTFLYQLLYFKLFLEPGYIIGFLCIIIQKFIFTFFLHRWMAAEL